MSTENAFTDFLDYQLYEEENQDYIKQFDTMEQRRSNRFILDFTQLYMFDEDLALDILRSPYKHERAISTVIFSRLRTRNPIYAETLKRVTVGYKNILETTPIHLVKSSSLYRLLQINGTVVQLGEKNSRPSILVYSCPQCGENVNVLQDEQWLKEPEKCLACDNRKGFIKKYEETEFDDYQWIEIQELVENTPNSKTPEKIRILLKNDLVDSCVPGENITITGVPKVIEKSPNNKALEMKVYVEAMNLENDTEEQTLDLTTEDIAEIRKLMDNPNHLRNVIKSYAPTVYGLDRIKEALAYQQCEGVTKHIDGDRQRGQFHILLAGPPGVAKSVLGKYSARYHPKGREAAARSASAAGLTAAVVKDGDEFVLKAGAMVLADRGFLFVDEAEKMSREDSGAMHPGMEAQEFEVNKGGINANMKCRCSIVMACNPIGGVWNDDETLIPNLSKGNQGLELPLLSRCALIYVVRMEVDKEKERQVINHIATMHQKETVEVPYSFDTMRKIFSYARTFEPVVPDKVMNKLMDFYITLFEAGQAEESTLVTRRDFKDMVRIAEASAKLHGRTEATIDDADNAMRVKTESIKEYGIDPVTGKVDQTIIELGKPASRLNRMKQIYHFISNHLNKDGYIEYDDLESEIAKANIKERELSALLEEMERIVPAMIYRNGDRIYPS